MKLRFLIPVALAIPVAACGNAQPVAKCTDSGAELTALSYASNNVSPPGIDWQVSMGVTHLDPYNGNERVGMRVEPVDGDSNGPYLYVTCQPGGGWRVTGREA